MSNWECSVCGGAVDYEEGVVVSRKDEDRVETDFHIVHPECEASVSKDEYPFAINLPSFNKSNPGVLYPGHSDSRIPEDKK